jgi:hypothetical protein
VNPGSADPPEESVRTPLSLSQRELATRLRGTFGVAYLTLTGVTQSVAMAVLAARVEATYEDFHFVNWIMAINTFLVIVVVWNDYMIAAIAYFWTPTLADAFFPFTLLALQLGVAHNVYPDERMWFLWTGLLLAVGCAAFGYGFWQAERHTKDNHEVLQAIGIHRQLTLVFTGAGCVPALGIAALYDVGGLHRASTMFALLGTVLIAAILVRSIPYWKRVTDFSRVRDDGPRPAPIGLEA